VPLTLLVSAVPALDLLPETACRLPCGIPLRGYPVLIEHPPRLSSQ
jgi:hypothetical protein